MALRPVSQLMNYGGSFVLIMRGMAGRTGSGGISGGAFFRMELRVALRAKLFERVNGKQLGVRRFMRGVAGQTHPGLERTMHPFAFVSGSIRVQRAVALETKLIHAVAQLRV